MLESRKKEVSARKEKIQTDITNILEDVLKWGWWKLHDDY